MEGSNDNNDPWVSLAAATARALRFDEKQNDAVTEQNSRDRSDEQKRNDHENYVQQRIRELAAFERRARGGR